jgi:beta-lactamase regulating signal transducer with metallopeptidase domain
MRLPDIFLSDAAAKAICWTLAHSLWQGILVAALAGIIIYGTRKLPVVIRYNLLAADLLLFLLIAGATFGYELRQADRALPVETAMTALKAGDGVIAHFQQHVSIGLTGSDNFIQRTNNYLNTHAPVISLAWLACLLAQLLRLTGGLYQVHRIRRNGVLPSGEYWKERLPVLARRLGITRTVTLLQSGLVKAPSAFGFLKPSILMPIGILSNLPPDQVETILLHELAHIRRGDYITNLFLHLAEAIFFFNPGLRWVAALIRREREACCDDMVLAGTPDRNSYFEALVAFTQLAVDQTAGGDRPYAPQLGGGRTDLLWRIKRMLNKENKKLQVMEKAILSFGLMALVSVSLISMKPAVLPAKKTPMPIVPSIAKTDTTPRVKRDSSGRKKITIESLSIHSNSDEGRLKYHAIATDEEGNRYEIRKQDGQVTVFRLNDELIPMEEYNRYSDVFASIEAARKNIPRPVAPVAPVAPMSPMTPMTSVTPAAPMTAVRPAQPVSPAAPVSSPQPVAPVAPVPPVAPQAEPAPTLAHPLVYTNNPNPYVERITADLIKISLIPDVDEFSFTLNTSGLTVNDVKQPDEIYQKFRTKYIKHPNDHFIYSQYYTPHGSGTHCIVNTDPDGPSN